MKAGLNITVRPGSSFCIGDVLIVVTRSSFDQVRLNIKAPENMRISRSAEMPVELQEAALETMKALIGKRRPKPHKRR